MRHWAVFVSLAAGAMSLQTESAIGQRSGAANPDAVITTHNARFTVLTPALLRLEWSPDDTFEDRPSQAFINRRLPVPNIKTASDGPWLIIDTGELTLRYKRDGGRFTRNNLSIELSLNGRKVTWTPGTPDTGNLLGTCRTLDGVSGPAALEPGLLSRDGWTLVDDSDRLVFDSGDPPWLTARKKGPSIDWTFFGYGHDYKRALRDFTKVAGRIPLPPRFVFGAWWSRYWAYTDQELRDLVGQFNEHGVPLDVLVIDMDWHMGGWTGYTWNPKYFPDPTGFLSWVHEQGLHTTLNLHPADGVGKHEAAFGDMAKALGLDPDPEKVDRVPFDCADPKYMAAYFKFLHRPLERQGIDFWWIDWQQGGKTAIPGLDPLWWLNHLHWMDMQRRAERTGRRPLIFSRWGGLGNHRYQIGFSGDTFCNWPSLAFQPFFTATAGNVGFAYWSHDIGGHQPGPVDPELYARWIQYGAFSPILRTHTTKNPKAERRIWAFPDEVFKAARAAFELRYTLIPYIYTAARQCYDTGLPLCRPLYYERPELDEAYEHGGAYLFGDDLLVAPVTEPVDAVSGCAQVKVWLPQGEWTNWFTGRTYDNPCGVRLLVPLDEIPLFVRSGAIIPTLPKRRRVGGQPLDPLILHIWPGDSGKTRVYDDDGVSPGYTEGQCAWTPVSHKLIDGKRRITIGPVEGSYTGMPAERKWEIRLRDVWPAESVTLNGVPFSPAREGDAEGWSWHPAEMSTEIRLPAFPADRKIELIVTPHAGLADEQPLRSGLRGQVSLLESVLRTTGGDAAPDSITKAVSSQLDPDAAPEARLESARKLQHGWAGLISDLFNTSISSQDIARKNLIRLLGLYHKVSVTGDPDGSDGLTARIEVSPTLRLPGAERLSGQVTMTAAEPWHIEGGANWRFEALSEAKPFVATTTLDCGGSRSTGVLRATVNIEQDGVKIDLPIEKVFLPSINAWWTIGPFDAPFEKGLRCKFPPEEQIDLKARYKGKDGRMIGWKQVQRRLEPGTDLTDEFFVDFDDVFDGRQYDAVAYALCYLHAPQDTDATLALGTDDGVIVWLNGKQVHRNAVGRAYTSRQDRVPVHLRQGANTLLLKINQGGGDWGFCVHVETPDGGPIPQVKESLSP